MMTIGEHIMLLRKKKGLSQNDLGKAIGTSGDIIGRYERDAMSPTIQVIMRLADALDVSIDYLVGKTKFQLDKDTMERLEDLAKLPEDKRAYVFALIDMCLRDFKTRRAYAKSA
jgi:transcriptional regulator with XRE-family HTH domain